MDNMTGNPATQQPTPAHMPLMDAIHASTGSAAYVRWGGDDGSLTGQRDMLLVWRERIGSMTAPRFEVFQGLADEQGPQFLSGSSRCADFRAVAKHIEQLGHGAAPEDPAWRMSHAPRYAVWQPVTFEQMHMLYERHPDLFGNWQGQHIGAWEEQEGGGDGG